MRGLFSRTAPSHGDVRGGIVATSSQGIDLGFGQGRSGRPGGGAGGRSKKVYRRAPKSQNVYLKLLVKVRAVFSSLYVQMIKLKNAFLWFPHDGNH